MPCERNWGFVDAVLVGESAAGQEGVDTGIDGGRSRPVICCFSDFGEPGGVRVGIGEPASGRGRCLRDGSRMTDAAIRAFAANAACHSSDIRASDIRADISSGSLARIDTRDSENWLTAPLQRQIACEAASQAG